MVFLTRQRFNHQPKRFADLGKFVYYKRISILTKFILVFELVNIDHYGRHDLTKLRVSGEKCLILTTKFDKPHFSEHDVYNLGFESRIWQLVIKQRVVSLFPALYYEASKIYQINCTILSLRVTLSFYLSSLEQQRLTVLCFLSSFPSLYN